MPSAYDEALRVALSLPEEERRRLVAQIMTSFGRAGLAALGRPPGRALDDGATVIDIQRRITTGAVVSEDGFRAHLAQKHGVR